MIDDAIVPLATQNRVQCIIEQEPHRRIVVLISGSGTNLQALIDAQRTPSLPHAHIVLVLSNRKSAFGLTRASSASPPIPTAYLSLQTYLKTNPGKTRQDYDEEVARIVVRARPDVVVLAGWMHVLSERFLDIMSGAASVAVSSSENCLDEKRLQVDRPIPVLNLHPALPGAFDGADAIPRAYSAFHRGQITHSGAMVHRVVKEVDRGEPIVVREVDMREGERLESFEARVHEVEWKIIVEATAKVLQEVKPV